MIISILGYGKMGRLIEKVALEKGHQIAATIDNENEWVACAGRFKNSDVAIDFSVPDTAVNNIFRALENNVPIVVGTTGWHDRLQEVEKKCAGHGGKIVYGTNFSVGVNIFFKINRLLARLMNGQDAYRASVSETHHIHKKDAPSGTAITLANDILSSVHRMEKWQLTPCVVEPEILPVTAIRVAEVPGSHEIRWSSAVDDIVIRHDAHSREGFAQGAVLAAEWLISQPSGIYRFDEVFDKVLNL